ncbi:MAG: hypothetical protein M5U28_15105 [Sandaracinaceae bacterium]|nr:hypothetical protein [Sandaracinaceae bacterium]
MRAALALLLLLIAAPASAQLAEGERAEREGRILDADAAYRRALAAGGLAPSDTARAHLRLGVLARAVGGDAEEAQRHFAVALAVDPRLAAPDELPPAERARFEALRGSGLAIAARVEDGELRVEVSGPPVARSVRVRVAGRDHELSLAGGRASMPAQAGSAEVTALDEHGNALRVERLELALPSVALPEVPAPEQAAAEALLDCPTTGDACGWPARCRPAAASCGGGEDVGPIVGGVVGAILGVAAIVVTAVLVVDAHQSSLWRIDRAGTM